MLELLFKSASTLEAYRASFPGPYLDSFSRLLLKLGYARSTVQGHLWLTFEFGRWLAQRGLSLADLNEEIVEAFVSAPCSRRFLQRGLRITLRRFLTHLREQGASPAAAAKGRPSELETLEAEYERHLREERGVTALRSFLRFLLRQGAIAADLAASVPSVADKMSLQILSEPSRSPEH